MSSLFKLYMRIRTSRMRRKEQHRLRDLKSTTDSIMELYEASIENEISIPDNLKHLPPIAISQLREMYNTGLFVLTIVHDTSSLSFMLLMETELWNRQNLSRQLSVLMYECIDDLLKMFGKEFRRYLRKLPGYKALEADLNSIISQIHCFEKKHREYLFKISQVCC